MTTLRLLFTLFVINHCSLILAADAIVLNDSDQEYDIGNQMDFLIDKNGTWTVNEIASNTYDKLFFKPANGYLYPEDMDAVYWARFTINNQSSPTKNWLIEVLNFGTKELSFYRTNREGNLIKVANTGADHEFHDRVIDHKNFEFDIPPEPKKSSTYYLRFRPAGPSKMAVVIKSYERFISYSLGEYYLLGFFYGIIAVMVIYNLILFFSLRVRTYLFYVFYVASIGLASIGQDGTGFQYLWPQHPEWNTTISELALFGIIIATILYSRNFLDIKSNSPRIDQILKILSWVVVSILLYVELFDITNLFLLIPIAAVPFILILFTSFKVYRSGFRPARFFIIGFTFFFIGFAIKILAYFGSIYNSPFTYYAHNLGILVEMIFFSAAIADRFKTLRIEKENALTEKNEQLRKNEILKDKVNKELEQKVEERTIEIKSKNDALAEANQKLKELTDEVNHMNLQLDLDNRKLQKDIKEVSRSRVMLQDVNLEEFTKVYPTERDCMLFLANLKWNKSYACRKCGNDKSSPGKNKFSKRCTKCNYDESATANTLFHRLKFPIQKAFYLVYLVNSRDGNITSDELSEQLDLRRETCWSFKKKITGAIAKSSKDKRNQGSIDGWGHLVLVD